MLTVWGRKSSSNVQAVLWCLAELPHLARYYRDLAKRSAYREHVMVSYGELADSM